MNIYKRIAEIISRGETCVVVTVAETYSGSPGKEGFKLVVTKDGNTYGTIGGGAVEFDAVNRAKELFKEKKNLIEHIKLKDEGMNCGGDMTLFYEYIRAKKMFLLFGGGHIGRALAPLLEMAGFFVTVFDSRPEIKEYFSDKPDRNVVIADYNDISIVKDELIAADYCFIATHGHSYDSAVLQQLLDCKKSFTYVGLIGSKAKVKTAFRNFEQRGYAIPSYIYSPAGLKIGGDTAGEIAISIAAEVLSVEYGVDAIHMRINPQLNPLDAGVQKIV